jgi:hypothetical protein
MKKGLLALFSTLLVVFAAACSSEQTGVETKEKETASETNTKPEEKKEEKKEPVKGTRSNPVAFNETAIITQDIYDDNSESYEAKIELSIIEVIRGQQAFDILKKENQFNEPAPDGFEWVLVKAKGKVVESETEDYPYWLSGMNFKFVGSDGKVSNEEVSAVVPDELADELYNGAEGEGYFADVVKVNDDFKLEFEGYGSSVFFNSK